MDLLSIVFNSTVEPTLMSAVCERSLGQSASSVQCQQWFADALTHCSKQLIVTERPHWSSAILSWFPRQTHPASALEVRDQPHPELYKSDAYLLGPMECRSLLYRVAMDYAASVERIAFSGSSLQWSVAALLLFLLLLVGLAAFAAGSMDTFRLKCCPKRKESLDHQLLDSDKTTEVLRKLLHKFMLTQPFSKTELQYFLRVFRMRRICKCCDVATLRSTIGSQIPVPIVVKAEPMVQPTAEPVDDVGCSQSVWSSTVSADVNGGQDMKSTTKSTTTLSSASSSSMICLDDDNHSQKAGCPQKKPLPRDTQC